MNNIIIYLHKNTNGGLYSIYGFYEEKETITTRLDFATRLEDMKSAIHKGEELRKQGYETQLLIIL